MSKETRFVEVEVSTNDRVSFESGTVRIRFEARLDRRVAMDPKQVQALVDRLQDAMAPFSEWARPL